MNSNLQAAIAAHRFGLGETQPESAVRGDARGWLAAQIGPADGLRRFAEFVQQRKRKREAESMTDMSSTESSFSEHFRVLVQADTRARLTTAAVTQRPFAERLALFWRCLRQHQGRVSRCWRWAAGTRMPTR